MDDKVVRNRRFIPSLNRVFDTNVLGETPHHYEDSISEHDDLVRLYPFPPKNENGEYDPPIDLHDGVSEVVYASGRTITVIVKGCHSKEQVAKEDKTPATTVLDGPAKSHVVA